MIDRGTTASSRRFVSHVLYFTLAPLNIFLTKETKLNQLLLVVIVIISIPDPKELISFPQVKRIDVHHFFHNLFFILFY